MPDYKKIQPKENSDGHKKNTRFTVKSMLPSGNEMSLWESVTDYVQNVNDIFNNTVSDVSEQYTDLYTTVNQSIPASLQYVPSLLRNNPSPSSQNKVDLQTNLDTNSKQFSPTTLYQPDRNPTMEESIHLRKGLFQFLPQPNNLVSRNRNKSSRTTSIDQVRSSLNSMKLMQYSQQNKVSLRQIKEYELDKKESLASNLTETEDSEKFQPFFIEKNNSSPKMNQVKESIASSGGNSVVSDAEAASELAEGTILALRDMILDEAVELHESLRFWTERWERPYLSWLEAGPQVWIAEEGYNHLLVGQKVSQIQAVLARRCATIGELQEHLLRAGWRRKGIAKWGVLGQGEQWATVAGNDGVIESKLSKQKGESLSRPSLARQRSVEILTHSTEIGTHGSVFVPEQTPSEHRQKQKDKKRLNSLYYGHSSVFVKNIRGGQILTNDPAVASWSVDAIRVLRDQLYRAGNVDLKLPYYYHWPQETAHFENLDIENSAGHAHEPSLPIWAKEKIDDKKTCLDNGIIITDLSALASEVSELLNSMEIQLQVQKERRLQKLKPPRAISRSWYLFAAGIPVLGYLGYKLFTAGRHIELSRHIILKMSSFYAEHFSEPIRSIFTELVSNKGRENITDQKARMNAMGSLKKMIKDWLDEVYPKMPESERSKMSAEMDISLLEKRKEASLNHALFEIQDIVQMSIIEMQFIKKELMNAMSAIDELMDSNEINFRLGAILPAFMVIYGVNGVFRYLRYALLKLGKSREQTHESIRQILLDIERLLVVRDDPPDAPAPLVNKGMKAQFNPVGKENQTSLGLNDVEIFTNDGEYHRPDRTLQSKRMLSSDDLGMLMLLIHELRSIIWKNRRRFSNESIRNITEDLSELSGERGAISIKQQLQIISRMYRTYSFLKVVSTGLPLESRRLV